MHRVVYRIQDQFLDGIDNQYHMYHLFLLFELYMNTIIEQIYVDYLFLTTFVLLRRPIMRSLTKTTFAFIPSEFT
jgi:hypothetical protein